VPPPSASSESAIAPPGPAPLAAVGAGRNAAQAQAPTRRTRSLSGPVSVNWQRAPKLSTALSPAPTRITSPRETPVGEWMGVYPAVDASVTFPDTLPSLPIGPACEGDYPVLDWYVNRCHIRSHRRAKWQSDRNRSSR